jgi:hypothetical protein
LVTKFLGDSLLGVGFADPIEQAAGVGLSVRRDVESPNLGWPS